MNPLLINIRNAKVTSREVYIYLKKNGLLKRHGYKDYLKLQYKNIGDIYTVLRQYNIPENNLEHKSRLVSTNPDTELKISEIGLKGKIFNDVPILTQVCHSIQKEILKNTNTNKSTYCTKHSKGPREIGNSVKELQFISTNEFSAKNQRKSNPQTQIHVKIPPASSFNQLNHHYLKTTENNLLCNQILKWVLEGNLNLN